MRFKSSGNGDVIQSQDARAESRDSARFFSASARPPEAGGGVIPADLAHVRVPSIS
jgi:hypothetical protein